MFQQRTASFLVGILCLSTCPVFAQTAGLGHSEFRELVQQADQLYVQQRYAEVEAKYREALRLPESAASEEARSRIRCNLGLAAAGLEQYGEAEPMLKDCPASTPAERFVAWTNLATLYSHTNRYAEADRLFLQAYNLARQNGGITPIQRALLTESMACQALRKGNYQEAEPLLREARDFYAKTGSAWDSANATGNLGVALVKEGRLEDARAEMERAIHETEALGGPSHPMLAGLLGALASVDNREGRFADAESRLKRAFAVASPDYPCLPELLSTYAWTLRHLHRASEARRLDRRARALASTRRPPEVVSVSELLRESGKR
jgi:tetratricopeptide (TPR) repeat protein